jgi:hypothetical protein
MNGAVEMERINIAGQEFGFPERDRVFLNGNLLAAFTP